MARLTVPIVTCVIGEGGSGGAIALGVANVVLMDLRGYSTNRKGCDYEVDLLLDQMPIARKSVRSSRPPLLT